MPRPGFEPGLLRPQRNVLTSRRSRQLQIVAVKIAYDYGLYFTQNDSHLITGCNDKVIRLFNLGSPDSEPQLFQEHKEAIKCAVWAGDQNYFVSAEEIAEMK